MNIIIAGKCLWKYQNELNKTLKEISITYHDILFGNTTCLIVLNGNLPVTIQTLSLGKMTLKLRASTLISTVKRILEGCGEVNISDQVLLCSEQVTLITLITLIILISLIFHISCLVYFVNIIVNILF